MVEPLKAQNETAVLNYGFREAKSPGAPLLAGFARSGDFGPPSANSLFPKTLTAKSLLAIFCGISPGPIPDKHKKTGILSVGSEKYLIQIKPSPTARITP
jgi:hypothetical protein